jgi:hypothetical protein
LPWKVSGVTSRCTPSSTRVPDQVPAWTKRTVSMVTRPNEVLAVIRGSS